MVTFFSEKDGKVLRIDPVDDIYLPVRWFIDSEAIEKWPYHVRVGTETFPVGEAGRAKSAYSIRFQVREAFPLHIDVELVEGHLIHIQPRRYQNDLSTGSNGKLNLEIDEPGPRVIMMKSEEGDLHTPLIILAET